MKIAIIDADLVQSPKKHRFPNLACMKISGYYKSRNNTIELKLNYEELSRYDKVFISKVFTKTKVPEEVLDMKNVEYGGTGFYYDKAPSLPYEIEHYMPDYNLYEDWVNERLELGDKRKSLEYYLDFSIGFTTRGCIRGCDFCVNKNSKEVLCGSYLKEFLDEDKPKICLLDDNILAYKDWKDVILQLQQTKKKFQFKQGMDIRLLTPEKAELLIKSKYAGDYIFAFDNIEDTSIIEKKLKLWKTYNKSKGQNTKLYVFCAFDRLNIYNMDFWKQDIVDLFKRIKILMKYNCKPYVMRYEEYKNSPYYGMYVNIATWANQPSLFSNHTYQEFCDKDNDRKGGNSATKRYNIFYKNDNIKTYEEYSNIKLKDISLY